MVFSYTTLLTLKSQLGPEVVGGLKDGSVGWDTRVKTPVVQWTPKVVLGALDVKTRKGSRRGQC